MLRSEEERAAYAAKDKAAREKHWHDLLAELRKANPSQKIVYRDSSDIIRYVVIDGTRVEIRLDEQRPAHGNWVGRPNGVYYFTIGGYRRFGGSRPRAVCGKNGFNWAKIAQLMEGERASLVAKASDDARAETERKAAADTLDKLFKRRPDLEDMRLMIGVHARSGTFSFTVLGMDVATLEGVLNLAKKLAAT